MVRYFIYLLDHLLSDLAKVRVQVLFAEEMMEGLFFQLNAAFFSVH